MLKNDIIPFNNHLIFNEEYDIKDLKDLLTPQIQWVKENIPTSIPENFTLEQMENDRKNIQNKSEREILNSEAEGDDPTETIGSGGNSVKSKKLKKTDERIKIGNKTYIVYIGIRGGKYVKKQKEYVSLKKIVI